MEFRVASMIERSALELGHEVGKGGQGRVLEISNWVWPNAPAEAEIDGLVYKEYLPAALESIDAAALESMPPFLENLSTADQISLLRTVAWPIATVHNDGKLTGFVMPRIVKTFLFERLLAKGTVRRELATAQFLMNSGSYMKRIGVAVDGRQRCAILADLANAVAFLHQHGVVVGDISATNVLWSTTPTCRGFLIDADSMVVGVRSATPRVETPDWDVPTGAYANDGDKAAADNYKLGLMVLRLLTGSMATRDPQELAPSLSSTRELVQASLSTQPSERPSADDWAVHLGELVRQAVELAWLDAPPSDANSARSATGTKRGARSVGHRSAETPARPNTPITPSYIEPAAYSSRCRQPHGSHRVPQERPVRPDAADDPLSPRHRILRQLAAMLLGIITAVLLAALLLLCLRLGAGDRSADAASMPGEVTERGGVHAVQSPRPASAGVFIDADKHVSSHGLVSLASGARNTSDHKERKNQK